MPGIERNKILSFDAAQDTKKHPRRVFVLYMWLPKHYPTKDNDGGGVKPMCLEIILILHRSYQQ